MAINDKSGAEGRARLTTPSGSETIGLSKLQAAIFDCDPDDYAARHFGFASAQQYADWIRTDGRARCAATTKAGKPCGAVRGLQLEADQWRKFDRAYFCVSHGGEATQSKSV
jgi:hypothetical protein